MSSSRARVIIDGRVQGVSFRYYTQRQAAAWGVSGWVRNLADGRVEALFEGPEKGVRHMVSWCHQGPPNAFVTDVQVTPEPYVGDLRGFRVRY